MKARPVQAGYRKGFSDMNRRAPLPTITECVNRTKRTSGVSRSQLLRLTYPFLVVCVLSLAHVHLNFAKVDLSLQEGQLQRKRQALKREEHLLAQQLEQLCNPAELKRKGLHQFAMEESEVPTHKQLVQVSTSVRDKYLGPVAPAEGHVEVAAVSLEDEVRGEGMIGQIVTLLDTGSQAVAAAVPVRTTSDRKF